MHRRHLGALLLVSGVFAAVVAGVQAAAMPVSPTRGERIATSHPTFTWTTPTSETANALYVANRPERQANGFFRFPNLVYEASFSGETRWTPETGIYAGHYWWMVGSYSRSPQAHFWSPVSDFTILPSLSLRSVGAQRFRSLRLLHVTARWRSNVEWLGVRLRILWRGKVIWRRTQAEHNVVDIPGSTIFAWNSPRRIKRGTRLTLEVTAFAQGVKSSRRLAVRAP